MFRQRKRDIVGLTEGEMAFHTLITLAAIVAGGVASIAASAWAASLLLGWRYASAQSSR